MPDLAQIEHELIGRYPEPWVRHHLASFQPAYFATFDTADVIRHLGQIIALTDEQPVAVRVWPEGPGAWRVEFVGYDAFQLLSTLCSLLAIHGLAIVEGQAFTSQPTRAPARRVPRPGRHPGRHLRPPPGARTVGRGSWTGSGSAGPAGPTPRPIGPSSRAS